MTDRSSMGVVCRAMDEDVSRYLAGVPAGRVMNVAAAAGTATVPWSLRSRSASPVASAAVANSYPLPVSSHGRVVDFWWRGYKIYHVLLFARTTQAENHINSRDTN